MPEETTTTAVVEEKTPVETDEKKPETTDADKPLGPEGEKALEAFKQRAREAESKLKAVERRVQEFEDKDKTELERATSQRDAAAKERDEAKAESLRLRVAIEKKLPAELIDRLRGSNEKELQDDADELLKLVKPADETDFDNGARTTTKTVDMNEFIRSGGRK